EFFSRAESSRSLFDDSLLNQTALVIEGAPHTGRTLLPVSERGYLRREHVSTVPPPHAFRDDQPRTQFITTESWTAQEVAALWQSVALTVEEDLVIRALRLLEPRIERLAFVGAPGPDSAGARGGFYAKLSGY